MSLVDTAVIDLIAVTPDGTGIALVIGDDGSVPDPVERELTFRRKLAAYLHFVVSGELVARDPEHAGRTPFILVVCQTAPTESMLDVESIGLPEPAGLVLNVEFTTNAEFLRIFAQSR